MAPLAFYMAEVMTFIASALTFITYMSSSLYWLLFFSEYTVTTT